MHIHHAVADPFFFTCIRCAQVNEAWFGMNTVTSCNLFLDVGPAAHHHLTALTPRPVVNSLTTLWGGSAQPPSLTCDQLKPCWSCTTGKTDLDIRKGACDAVCNLNFAATYSDGSSTPPPPSSTGTNNNNGGGGGDGTLNNKGAAAMSLPSAFVVIVLAVLAMWM
jgi:hypothetical protein